MSVTTATAASPMGTPPPVPTSIPTSVYGTLPDTAMQSATKPSALKTWLHRLLPIGLALGGAAAGFFLLGGPLPAVALGVGGLLVGTLAAKLIK